VTGDALIKNGAMVTWCCGPSLPWRSGSSTGEPIVKLPSGIETISSLPAEPSLSLNTAALYFSDGFRTPFESTVATSKAIARKDGFDMRLRIEGAAMMAPVPATTSAATPSACRRVTLRGRLKKCRPGMAGRAAGAIEALGAATVDASCSTRVPSLAMSRFSRLVISAKSDSHRLWLSSNPLR
jgi:hypothetical protein